MMCLYRQTIEWYQKKNGTKRNNTSHQNEKKQKQQEYLEDIMRDVLEIQLTIRAAQGEAASNLLNMFFLNGWKGGRKGILTKQMFLRATKHGEF